MVMTRDDPQRQTIPSLPTAARVTDPTGQGSLSTAEFRAPLRLPLRSWPLSATVLSAYRWVAFYRASVPLDSMSDADPEMRLIEADPVFYGRLVTRLNRPGRLIPAEEVLGDLDSDDDS